MKKYKVYINHQRQVGEKTIQPGCYSVISDNATQSNTPSASMIETPIGQFLVPIETPGFFNGYHQGCFAVWPDFEEKFLNAKTEYEMRQDLESLRPSDMTVEEYVSYFPFLKTAWVSAMLKDWGADIRHKAEMDQIFAKALLSRV